MIELNLENCSAYVKLYIGKEDLFFGPGHAHFLALIHEHGSIQKACKSMKMSYSKGWTMLNNLEEKVGFKIIDRSTGGNGGGSSHLTKDGLELLVTYQKMKADLEVYNQQLNEKHLKTLSFKEDSNE